MSSTVKLLRDGRGIARNGRSSSHSTDRISTGTPETVCGSSHASSKRPVELSNVDDQSSRRSGPSSPRNGTSVTGGRIASWRTERAVGRGAWLRRIRPCPRAGGEIPQDCTWADTSSGPLVHRHVGTRLGAPGRAEQQVLGHPCSHSSGTPIVAGSVRDGAARPVLTSAAGGSGPSAVLGGGEHARRARQETPSLGARTAGRNDRVSGVVWWGANRSSGLCAASEREERPVAGSRACEAGRRRLLRPRGRPSWCKKSSCCSCRARAAGRRRARVVVRRRARQSRRRHGAGKLQCRG